MNAEAPRWRGALWWVIPVLALLLLLGLETDWGRHLHRLPGAPLTVEPKPVSTALLPEYQIQGGLPGHAETVNRTLFNPTRRPAPMVAGDGGPHQMQRGQFVLTGTAVAGDRHIAFLKEVSGGKSRSVRQGEQINGLLVADVRADRVKLALGDESEELILKVSPGPKTTIQPPTTPPAGGAPPGAPAAAPAPVPAAVPAAAPAPQVTEQQQRRRAAAAAAAAAAAGNPPAAAATGTNPASNQASPAGASGASAGQPASADPAWNEVYERMRQRNPQPNPPQTK
jgi:hypothetical protein